MAITGGATITVTSAAADEFLGNQSQQSGNDQIVFSDTISNLSNGNLMTSPSYANRLVVIRLDEVDEETRYIQDDSAGTGTTRVCTVHEDWDSVPASGDLAHVCYICYDADTIGNDFKALLKRNTDWAAADEMVIGNGTDFAFFALLDGHSIETVDNSSTTVADFAVESSGRFDSGYTSGGLAVSGGYIVGTPAVDGELVFDFKSGSISYLNDFFTSCVYRNMSWFNGTSTWEKVKLFKALYTMDLTGDLSVFQNSVLEGTGNSNEYIQCDASTTFDQIAIISTQGLTTDTTSGAETMDMANVTFINNNRMIQVYDDKTWNMVNPVWSVDTTTQNDISFDGSTNTNNEVNELFELTSNITDTSATAIQYAELWIYEGVQSSGLVNHDTSDAAGDASATILKRNFTNAASGLSVISYSDFALRVYRYGKTPIVSSLAVTSAIDRPITLLTDSAITNSNQNSAQVTANDASVVHWGDPSGYAKPAVLCPYEYGSGTITEGETVRVYGGSNIGTIEEEVDGTDVTGRIFINDRTTQSLSDGTLLEGVTSGWTAYAVQPAEYSWEVNCNSHSMTEMYDWLAANMASGDPTTVFRDAIEWGEDEHSQLVYKSTNYYTERNVNLEEGVWFSNKGAGNFNYMTSDSGYQYVPPTSYTLTITGLQSNSEVRLYKVSDGQELGGVENSSTTWQYGYTYTADIPVYLHILHLDYVWLKVSNITLSNSDQSVPVQQLADRNYENP